MVSLIDHFPMVLHCLETRFREYCRSFSDGSALSRNTISRGLIELQESKRAESERAGLKVMVARGP